MSEPVALTREQVVALLAEVGSARALASTARHPGDLAEYLAAGADGAADTLVALHRRGWLLVPGLR